MIADRYFPTVGISQQHVEHLLIGISQLIVLMIALGYIYQLLGELHS